MSDLTDLSLYTKNMTDTYTGAQKVAAMEKKAEELAKKGRVSQNSENEETDEKFMKVCKDFEAYDRSSTRHNSPHLSCS